MIKKVLTIFFLTVFPFIPAYPSSPGTSIFNFLKINPSPRTAAIADVNGIASSQALSNNPAIIPWLKSSELSIAHLAYVADLSYSQANYVHSFNKKSALGISLGYLGAGTMTRTVYSASDVNEFSETGTFGASDMLLTLAYGRRPTRYFSYGVNVKVVRESIDDTSADGVLLSAGGYSVTPRTAKKTTFSTYNKNSYPNGEWMFGFGVFNVGPAIKNMNAPMGGFLNLGTSFARGSAWYAELAVYADEAHQLRTGFEIAVADPVQLRLGYRCQFKDPGLGLPITGGIGINIGTLSFDYGWVPYGDLGQTHRLAITTRFPNGTK